MHIIVKGGGMQQWPRAMFLLLPFNKRDSLSLERESEGGKKKALIPKAYPDACFLGKERGSLWLPAWEEKIPPKSCQGKSGRIKEEDGYYRRTWLWIGLHATYTANMCKKGSWGLLLLVIHKVLVKYLWQPIWKSLKQCLMFQVLLLYNSFSV